jgi:hypothetical protein
MPTVEGEALPFAEAIAFFRSKINITTERWDDLLGEAHDIAFTTAGATSAGLLQDIRTATDRAIAEGVSFETFKKDFSAIVDRYGWDHRGGREWRAQLIYRQNIYQSYAAGRYEQMTDPDLLRLKPYWQYRHGGSREPRLSHLAHDGKVYPADSPFWNQWLPPNGFGCSCSTFALSQRDLDRLGLQVEEPPGVGSEIEVVDPSNGQVRRVRNSPDRGFDYAPGRVARENRREEVLRQTLEKLDPDLRQQLEQFLANIPPPPIATPAPAPPAPPPQTWQEFAERGRNQYAAELAEIDSLIAQSPGDAQRLRELDAEIRDLDDEWFRQLGEGNNNRELRRQIKALQSQREQLAAALAEREQRLDGAFGRLRQAVISRADQSAAQVNAAAVQLGSNLPFAEPDYRAALQELYSISGNRVTTLSKLVYSRDRAYAARPGTPASYEPGELAGRINVGIHSDLAYHIKTLWHEFGHHVEFSDTTYQAAARAWILSKATSNQPQPLSVLAPGAGYDAGETAYPDDFVDPYVGKYYANGSTEVISMGLEHFVRPDLMRRLFQADRQHFDLILGFLGG